MLRLVKFFFFIKLSIHLLCSSFVQLLSLLVCSLTRNSFLLVIVVFIIGVYFIKFEDNHENIVRYLCFKNLSRVIPQMSLTLYTDATD